MTNWNRFRTGFTIIRREFVNAALFCTYYFGNTVYVVLVAASFKQVADTHTSPEWHMPIRTWILSLAIPLVPLGIIRTLKVLVPFSAIATAFILVGLGCTMSWVVTGVSLFADESALTAAVPLPDIGSRPWIAPVGHMPLFFATVLFAMEGIGTVLPIENSMRHPKRFLTARPCGVLNAAMLLVVCLYSVAGFLGYLRFGDATDGSITLNLPNDLFAESVKIMVALSILFSYGLQFCVPSEIVWARLEPWLLKRQQNNKYSANNKLTTPSTPAVNTIAGSTVSTTTAVTSTNTSSVNEKKQLEIESKKTEKPVGKAYYVMRGSMILGTVFIAALVPDLAPFISLIGAVFFSILGLMCPAVIHLVTFWNHGNEDGEDTDDETDSEGDLDFDGDYYAVDDDTDLEAVQRQPQRRRSSGRSTRRRRKGMSRWTVAKDVAIVMIALIALVSGTYASLVDIVAFYGSGGEGGGHHAANGTAVTTVTTTTIGPGPESAFLVAANGTR
uniref:Proton-coupled amino acid transporter 1 n=1 Tax=Melanaphis sacchari TaxID=742174 RepID=A0A2H8TVR9_9HEMI